MNIPVKILPHGSTIDLPKYATSSSAGMDLCAALETALILLPGEWQLIPTGIAIALPVGYEAQIRSRSGLALNYGVCVLNAPGTIDSDYRGEIKVMLINHGKEPYTVQPRTRIAQMVIARHETVTLTVVDDLDQTERNHQGFGSTGMF